MIGLQRETIAFNPVQLQNWLATQPPPTAEQQHIVNEVMEAFHQKSTLLLFVQGYGGCGKTWLLKYLLAKI